MKATFKVRSNLVIELEAGNQKDLFEKLSDYQEVFGVTKCGKCKSEELKFVVREDKDKNKYYELQCKCGARLSFGSHKIGETLFPKRKGDDDKWLPDNGWTKWDKEKQQRV
jgi:hypothetical protein